MTHEDGDFFGQFCAALQSSVKDEMRLQSSRNPSADRRRMLDTALRRQQEKIEKTAKAAELRGNRVSAETIRNLGKIALEEVGNEIRTTL